MKCDDEQFCGNDLAELSDREAISTHAARTA